MSPATENNLPAAAEDGSGVLYFINSFLIVGNCRMILTFSWPLRLRNLSYSDIGVGPAPKLKSES